MYCAACGSIISEELNYCNRCGYRVSGNELASGTDGNISISKNLAVATGCVGIAGLGSLVVLIAILVGNRVDPTVITILALMFAATAFGICFLLTRQISRLTEIANPANRHSKQKFPAEQLNSLAAAQIESPRETFVSATENTTRALDKTKV